jgi:uncharacterized protein YneF (UPF0154 family)
MTIITQFLSDANGIEIYPILFVLLFFAFFIVIGIKAYIAPKEYLDEMSHYPINDETLD